MIFFCILIKSKGILESRRLNNLNVYKVVDKWVSGGCFIVLCGRHPGDTMSCMPRPEVPQRAASTCSLDYILSLTTTHPNYTDEARTLLIRKHTSSLSSFTRNHRVWRGCRSVRKQIPGRKCLCSHSFIRPKDPH